MTEKWRPIPGWEGTYEVSDHGGVRSVERERVDALGRRYRYPGQVIAAVRNAKASAHLAVGLWRDGRLKRMQVHRLVLLAFVGPAPEGTEACHGDGDPTNNRLSNLRDAIRHGTQRGVALTHCKHGHEFTPENTYPRPEGGRACRACSRERSRRRKAAQRMEMK